jgi:DNA-3-methyladenine glycosylase
MIMSKSFYQSDDVVELAQLFLGKILVTNTGGNITSGIITETEAYAGIIDKASHAYGDRHTSRTAPMYLDGGISYVYLIYGIYSLFNIVTGPAGIPHAVLIRAVAPLDGVDIMMKRRQTKQLRNLCSGPGKLSQALGIHYSDTGTSLQGEKIWIEDKNIKVYQKSIIAGPRIGIDYAGEDAALPYRFIFEYKPKD